MKSILQATLLACTLAVPVLSYAQATDAPLTRAEVRADLVRLEQAGYNPAFVAPDYPADIQAAEAKAYGQQQPAPAAQPMSATPQTEAAPHAALDSRLLYGPTHNIPTDGA